MKANMSIYESILRIFLGALIAGIFGSMENTVGLIGVLALYPFVTGLSAWDPFYAAKQKYTNEQNPYTEHHELHSSNRVHNEEQSGQARKLSA